MLTAFNSGLAQNKDWDSCVLLSLPLTDAEYLVMVKNVNILRESSSNNSRFIDKRKLTF